MISVSVSFTNAPSVQAPFGSAVAPFPVTARTPSAPKVRELPEGLPNGSRYTQVPTIFFPAGECAPPPGLTELGRPPDRTKPLAGFASLAAGADDVFAG